MSARTRLILAVLGMLVLNLVFYFFFVRSRQSELNEVRVQVEDARNETRSLQAEVQRLEALRDRAPELQARAAELRKFVPRNNEVPSFIFQVQTAADAAGVDFVQITPEVPKPPPEGASLAEVRVQIHAEGGYFSIQDFIRRLYGLDRATRLDLFTLTGEEDQETGELLVTMESTARIFFELPPTGAVTTGTPGGTEPIPEPTPTPTP